MAGKYYVWQVFDGSYDDNEWITEDELMERDISIGGNSDYRAMNYDIPEAIYDMIGELGYEFENQCDSDGFEIEDLDDEDDYAAWLQDTVRYAVRMIDSNAESKLDDNDLNNIANIITQAYDTQEYDNAVAEIMTVMYKRITGEEYWYSQIAGSAQREWQDIFYPKSAQDNLDYIAACYFGTGIPLVVSTERSETAPDGPEDVDTYLDYTDEYSDAKIKEKVARDLKCSVNDIELLEIN